MQYIRSPINTICLGRAASMASLLLAAGAKGERRSLPNATIMIHQPSGGYSGQAKDISIHTKEIIRIWDVLNSLYTKHTGQPLDVIEKNMDLNSLYSKPINMYLNSPGGAVTAASLPMLRAFLRKSTPGAFFSRFSSQREMHTRNKKAVELIAKGFSHLKEVDRVIDYCERNDKRLIPQLRTAKELFELALEIDNTNTHARYWLSRLHLKYHVPGANKVVGAALLVEAAEMGDPEAQYALACHLRVENDYVQSDQQAFYYLEKAVDQLHPGALYLLGAVYLTGDCVKQDISSALWCFRRASEKGHAGAAVAYGSLLLKGVRLPESVTQFNVKGGSQKTKLKKVIGTQESNPVEMAREQFEIAARAGCDLGFRWLKRIEEDEQSLLSSQ